ncbi:MAG TPA: cytochrome-c oxidase, cbb3-type subunit III [Candidatus Azoamicus sp. OHIO1]
MIYFTRTSKPDNKSDHHSYDGIKELNEPLPIWWLWIFCISIIFGVVYLIIYPGLGKFKGIYEWSSHKECEEITKIEDKKYENIYITFEKEDIETLYKNSKAIKIGRSLFLNNCSQCHGIDAKGNIGFPNLTLNKWLYGGNPNEIKTTITNGRSGKMPPIGKIMGTNEDIENTALYVLSLSTNQNDLIKISKGKEKFDKFCTACHGLNANGNKFLGAPNLNDPKWVYGNTLENIKTTILNGRNGLMPAHKDVLSKSQIHLLTAYVYSLNND